MEYVLTTTRLVSGLPVQALHDTFTQALSGAASQLLRLVPDARVFDKSIAGIPVWAVGIGLLLLVGLLFIRRA